MLHPQPHAPAAFPSCQLPAFQEHRRPYPQDSLDLNLVIFSLALLPPLVSLLWLLLELVESWGMGPGWSAAAG